MIGDGKVMMGGAFDETKDLVTDQRKMANFDYNAKGQSYTMFSELSPAEYF